MVKREYSLYFDDKLIEDFDARIPPQHRSKTITGLILDFLDKKESLEVPSRTQGKKSPNLPKRGVS